ncbi:MAG TPA: DUF167 domain-containing protein [Candidatus Paceibacterota bacterium]|jgi:uncharacterized protein YggU (UPF0235/DUF167 family)|nr:DUF167 domain-containing protein [Candidatus Paceibacterota bacterium]
MFLKIRAKVNAKKENVVKKDDQTFIITVREKAERNEANRRICQIIADFYSLNIEKVHIIKGHKSPSKLLKIDLE